MTVLSSKSFHKSTTLALKNFCPNASFVFLHNFYLFCQVTLSGANSKNLSHCIDCFPVIILSRLHLSLLRSSFSPVLFVHTVSSFFIALILVAAKTFLALLCTSPVFHVLFQVCTPLWMQYCSCDLTSDLYNLNIIHINYILN